MIAPIAEIGPGEESNYQLQRGRRRRVAFVRQRSSRRHAEDLVIVEKGTLLFGGRQ